MRKAIIAANWKMYKTVEEALAYAEDFKTRVKGMGDDRQAVLIPTAICLPDLVKALEGTDIQVGAQNLYHEPQGAFTGEISAEMIAAVGARYVVVGHSERRQFFGETNASCNLKIKAAFDKWLIPIYCIGETLAQREAGITLPVIEIQVKEGLAGLTPDQVSKMVLAYEPVWAIGTGVTATKEQAQEVHEAIRNILADLYDPEVAEAVRIQYGGSVKPGNVDELMSMPDIDGALVGGAGLDPESFARIVMFE